MGSVMKLIDIGVNLLNPSFDKDREEVVENACQAGVSALIITGASVKTSLEAATYVERHPDSSCKLYFSAGVHPHEANTLDDGGLETLRRLGRIAVAIGECGLDYFRDYSPRPIQRCCFERQLELAVELSLPLFLHERHAFGDFSAMLKDFIPKVPAVVVHCFTGNEKELETYLDLGCHIGITGWICDERRGRHLLELVKKIPINRLMLETDSPYLLPRDMGSSFRGGKSGRNEPAFLVHIAQSVARHLGEDSDVLAAQTLANTCWFFGIKEQP